MMVHTRNRKTDIPPTARYTIESSVEKERAQPIVGRPALPLLPVGIPVYQP